MKTPEEPITIEPPQVDELCTAAGLPLMIFLRSYPRSFTTALKLQGLNSEQLVTRRCGLGLVACVHASSLAIAAKRSLAMSVHNPSTAAVSFPSSAHRSTT